MLNIFTIITISGLFFLLYAPRYIKMNFCRDIKNTLTYDAFYTILNKEQVKVPFH